MKSAFSIIAVVCLVFVAYGQDATTKESAACAERKAALSTLPQLPESAASPRHAFDVLNYTMTPDLYACFFPPYSAAFSSREVITFRVDSALNNIDLHAIKNSLTIDSVGLAAVSFLHGTSLLTLTLDRTYQPGDTVRVSIAYRHNDVADQHFYTGGGFVYTDCEPEGARYWFPCWDKPSDKATLDLTARVPSSARLGSNGRLADSVQVGDTTWYHWVSRDPIATYLMVISARVGYNLDIVYWHPVTHPTDSIPMRFYWNPGENSANLASIEQKIIPMTTRYSQLFGEHPFEKNGFATMDDQFVWGGMENQTLTSLCPDCWSENLVSHEFAHQWFGDMITCGTWADIWLNEGFATYCEALWYEFTGGYASYKSDINADASSYLGSNPGWAISNPAWATTTPPANVLFNYAITYAKGACVLHMLRYTLGDSLFFAALTAYATDSANTKYKNAVTSDFVAVVNGVAGRDMQYFFDQWIYQPNHPIYLVAYRTVQDSTGAWSVQLTLKEIQANAPFFTMPVDVKISLVAGQDTTVRVMHTQNNQLFTIPVSREPLALLFDPSNNIVLKRVALPSPSMPANRATGVGVPTTFRWSAVTGAEHYRLQVATDASFTMIAVDDSTPTGTSLVVSSLQPSKNYYWRIRGEFAEGVGLWSGFNGFTTAAAAAVDLIPGELPSVYAMYQNYPNPFNPSTTIRFDLPRPAHVRFVVYSLLGETVAQLADGSFTPGTYNVTWDAGNVASGVYFCRLEAGAFVKTIKVTLTR
jgi:aminopeptidase N